MHRTQTRERPRHAHRLAGLQKISLWVSGGLLLLTGCLWLAIHYSAGAGAGELPSPLEVWCIRLHGLSAFGGVFALGSLASAHIPHGWRMTHRRKSAAQRISGVLLCVMGALLVFTGYLLYYFAPEAIRPALGWAHALVGLAMVFLVISHRRGLTPRRQPSGLTQ